MSEIKWIKLSTDICASPKISAIRREKNGDEICFLWVLLLCLAGRINDGGSIYITKGIGFSEKGLSKYLGFSKSIVHQGLSAFKELGMIESENDIIKIKAWEKNQNTEGLERVKKLTRERVARHRRAESGKENEGAETGDEKGALCNAL